MTASVREDEYPPPKIFFFFLNPQTLERHNLFHPNTALHCKEKEEEKKLGDAHRKAEKISVKAECEKDRKFDFFFFFFFSLSLCFAPQRHLLSPHPPPPTRPPIRYPLLSPHPPPLDLHPTPSVIDMSLSSLLAHLHHSSKKCGQA